MTLASICYEVVDAVGINRPTGIVANTTDQLARQLLALAKETLDELCDEHDWPSLRVAYTFPTVASQASYAMPADFKRMVADTLYDDTNNARVPGAVTPQSWQRMQYQGNAASRLSYRMLGETTLGLVPTPSTVETIAIEYITNLPIVGSTSALTFVSDDDVAKVPARLIRMGLKWRLKHAKGLDYSEDYNTYQLARAADFAKQLALGVQPISSRNTGDIPDPYVPESGFGA